MPLDNRDLEWCFVWESPVAGLVPQELRLSPKCPVSFEKLSAETEKYIGSVPFLRCTCCALEEEKFRCNACMYAVGFHRCQKTGTPQWRKGTLHDGPLDFQRVLFNLHRKGVPTAALKTKADEFIANDDMTVPMAEAIVRTIEDERGKRRLANEAAGGEASASGARGRISDRLTLDDIKAELDDNLASPAWLACVGLAARTRTCALCKDKRVEMMRSGVAEGCTSDQARVYEFIVNKLESGEFLRLMAQASAGTGAVLIFR